MRSQGGRPASSSAGVSGSGCHKKQPSAGRVTAHSNRGDPAGQVSQWAEQVPARCDSSPNLPSVSF
eukprot:8271349-Pyramimonas_sp.AAC.1